MPDDIKSQMGLLDEIIAKKDLIKKEQEENIRVYTERFRALDKEYTELLAQKNEIQKYLDLAFVERKDELNRLIKEAEDVLIKNKEVLQGAYTKEYEVEKLRSDLAAKIADIDKKAQEYEAEREGKNKELVASLSEHDTNNVNLKNEVAKYRQMIESLASDRLEIDKRKDALDSREDELNSKEAEVIKLTQDSSAVLEENKRVLQRIIENRVANDAAVSQVNSEKAAIVKIQEDVAFREREIQKAQDDFARREESIEIGNKSLRRKLAEADSLYEKWKTEIAKLKEGG